VLKRFPEVFKIEALPEDLPDEMEIDSN